MEGEGNIDKARRARYKTTIEIEADIDRQKARVIYLRDKAYAADVKATYWFRKWGPKEHSDQRTRLLGRANKARERAAAMRQHAEKIDGGVLTRLKSKLAVMRTQLLPGIGSGDESIPKR